jgi:uncharacterized coiled-coil protein SlyX
MNPAYVWSAIGPNNNNNNNNNDDKCLDKRVDDETLLRDHRMMIAQIQDLQQHVFRNDCAIASMQSSLSYLADRLRALEATHHGAAEQQREEHPPLRPGHVGAPVAVPNTPPTPPRPPPMRYRSVL